VRSLGSYLALPRPKDAVKWWIFPATFLLGAAAGHGVSFEELARAAVAWFALELLVYQARYQWNDIRGFEADQAHPDSAGRGRLPGPVERGAAHKRASALVAVFRIALLGLLALCLPSLDLLPVFAALVAGVFGVALIYEVLRTRATGTARAVPPPVRPAIAALWFMVGGGYAVRGIAGLALGVSLTGEPLTAVAAAVALWAFGVAFVTSRWALEALAFAKLEDGKLAWKASADQAREHTLALVRWLPPVPEAEARPASAASWRALRGRSTPLAPWNVAAFASSAAAAVTGCLLAGSDVSGRVGLAALCGAAVALGVLASPRHRWAILGAGCLAALAVFGAAEMPRPLLALTPLATVLSAYLFFAGQSLSSLGEPLRDLRARAREATDAALSPAPRPASDRGA